MEIIYQPYFSLFLIIILGFVLENLRIRNISLDISAILFVSIILGYFGIVIPKDLRDIGLVLFIFTVGFQAGPSFFETLKNDGKKLAILSIAIILTGILSVVLVSLIFNFSPDIAGGIFTGALTSTPGFAAVTELSNNIKDSAVAYGVTYPFGVIGVVLFVKVLPKILRINIKQAENEYSSKLEEKYPKIINKNFVVENNNIIEKTLSEIKLREKSGVNISRVLYENKAFTPSPTTILHKGAIIKAVGTEKALKELENIVGPPTDLGIALDSNYDAKFVIVTNKKVIGKTLQDLHVQSKYNVVATRIRRSGVDFSAASDIKLQFGDKIKVVGAKEDIKKLIELIGDEANKLYENNYVPLSIGIILGILIGKLSLQLGSINLSLGLTGGVMFSAIILGRLRRIGPVVFSMTTAANQILRHIGLILFLSAVGTEAGSEIVQVLKSNVWQVLVSGFIVTLIPMIVGVVISWYFLKIDILTLLGVICGGMTSTPGLAAASSMTKLQAPSIAYATIYPLALVMMLLGAQVIFLIL